MISLNDIRDARERIKDMTYVTPILKSEQLSRICGNNIAMKSEHLQKTGSFKLRGAGNKIIHAFNDGARYLTTASSGNHGQAVAYVANEFGIPATIVVPENASRSKISAIRSYNGKVEVYGKSSEERLPRARQIAKQEKGVYIPPYDDPLIMAGQGTAGLEILEQLAGVDAVVVPIGGGGLISGILTAIKETKPDIKVIGVEPELGNDTYLSLQNGKITTITASDTIADGLRTSRPGELTFPVLKKYLDDIILVSEDEIRQAFSLVAERTKQLIEPSAATTIAACMPDKIKMYEKNIVTLISGGNTDLDKTHQFIVDTVK